MEFLFILFTLKMEEHAMNILVLILLKKSKVLHVACCKTTAQQKHTHNNNTSPHVVECMQYTCSWCQYCFCKGNLIWPTVNAEYTKMQMFN